MNPANTGGFLGTYRIGGVYRDQAASISGFGSDYRTPFLAIDVNFGFAFSQKTGLLCRLVFSGPFWRNQF
ncbi:MAG: hypothetical protein IPO78_16890 [Saprospiraceae bacterium]|nr:hypothetical protein [Saprospiraceae bacterium]